MVISIFLLHTPLVGDNKSFKNTNKAPMKQRLFTVYHQPGLFGDIFNTPPVTSLGFLDQFLYRTLTNTC